MKKERAFAHEVPLIHPVPIPISMVVSDVPSIDRSSHRSSNDYAQQSSHRHGM